MLFIQLIQYVSPGFGATDGDVEEDARSLWNLSGSMFRVPLPREAR